MKYRLLLPAIIAGFLAVTPAQAADGHAGEKYNVKQFTCPIGGDKFEQDVGYPHFSLVSFPDGSHPGDEFIDAEVPECPSNGLVLLPNLLNEESGEAESGKAPPYMAYTSSELALLPDLITSEDYKALAGEGRHMRAKWLADRLEMSADMRFELLKRAGWGAKDDATRRLYMNVLAEEGPSLINAMDGSIDGKEDMRFYVANALRELGRFDEALTMLEAIEAGAAKTAQPIDADEESAYSYYAERMRAVIAEKDDDRHPVGMLDDKWANMVCREIDDAYPPATETTKRGCAKREADRLAEDKLNDEIFALNEDAEKLDRMCAETKEAGRSEALSGACDQRARILAGERKDRDAQRLLADKPALDIRCKDISIGQYDSSSNALEEACRRRVEEIFEQKQAALVTEMEAEPGLFESRCRDREDNPVSEDPLTYACYSIRSDREIALHRAEAARLDAMTAGELEQACAAMDAENASGPLQFRCNNLAFEKQEAAWVALEADPAKLEATCALPEGEQEDWLLDRCYMREYDRIDAAARLLAADNAKLLALCAATPKPERDGVLYQACANYRKGVPVGDELDMEDMPVHDEYLQEPASEE